MQTIDDSLLILMDDGSYQYNDRPFTGVALQYAAGNRVVGEIHYSDGMQEGRARYWYPTGEPMGEEEFRRNSRHGLSREWYPSGALKRETVFEHGIKTREKTWDESGKLVSEMMLTKDKPLFKTLAMLRRIYG